MQCVTQHVRCPAGPLCTSSRVCNSTPANPRSEFITGPSSAGAFDAPRLDQSFGPRVQFVYDPRAVNLPPPHGATAGGWVNVDKDGVLKIELLNITGAPLYTKVLYPEESGRRLLL